MRVVECALCVVRPMMPCVVLLTVRAPRHIVSRPQAGSTYWAPVINLAREPRWGRNIEVPGEDPYAVGEYAEWFVKGFEQVRVGSDACDVCDVCCVCCTACAVAALCVCCVCSVRVMCARAVCVMCVCSVRACCVRCVLCLRCAVRCVCDVPCVCAVCVCCVRWAVCAVVSVGVVDRLKTPD